MASNNSTCKKIDVDLTGLDVSKIKGTRNNNYGPTFTEYTVINQDYLMQYVNERIHFEIAPEMLIYTTVTYPGAGPHIDFCKVALNYYADAFDEETFFFKEKEGYQGISHRDIKSYSLDSIEVIDKFIAKKGDCFLLNTHKIHAVKMPATDKVRTIVRFAWVNYSYDQIVDTIHVRDQNI